jgi:presequence protease
LNYLMLGTNASPLLKAMNDSGLGESVIGGGVEDELRQPVFSIGLKVSTALVILQPIRTNQ